MVSMARPLLADPDCVAKARAGRADEINTCIACNQACLDHVFENKPRQLPGEPARLPRDRARLLADAAAARTHRGGRRRAGRAGLRDRRRRARPSRHAVRRARSDIGGQFNLAKRIPGKEEFDETLRYFRRRIELRRRRRAPGRTRRRATLLGGFDEVVLATGVQPRRRRVPGHRPPEGAAATSTCWPGACGGRARRDHRRRRHRLRRRRVPGARGRHRRRSTSTRWLRANGASTCTTPTCAGGLRAAGTSDPRRAPAVAAAAQGRQAGRAAGQDHRLDPPRRAEGARRRDARRRGVRARRRRRPAHPRRRRAAQRSRSTTSWSAPARSRTTRAPTPHCTPRERRCRSIGGADVAAELDAKRAIAQGSRVAAAL